MEETPNQRITNDLKKIVPYEDICSFICRLDEKSKEKSVNQIERDLKDKNRYYAMSMSEDCYWYEYLNDLENFIQNYRHFDKGSYKWAIDQLSDHLTFADFETKMVDLPNSILHDIFRINDHKEKLLWDSMPSV